MLVACRPEKQRDRERLESILKSPVGIFGKLLEADEELVYRYGFVCRRPLRLSVVPF